MKMATRHNEGKLKWSLVDFDSLSPMVSVLAFGAKKYEIDNWKKGLYTTEVCESLLRHIFAYLNGEDSDPESELSHIGHIQVNAMFLGYMDKNMKEFDDRRGKKKSNEPLIKACRELKKAMNRPFEALFNSTKKP